MILKHILFKNFIIKTIKNKFNIIDLLLFCKQIVILYILFHIQDIQWLAINYFSILNSNLKIFNFFTNMPYVNNKKIDNFINNWQVLKQQLCLLKWIVYLIYLINKNQLQLPFNTIIKLVKKFIFLKKQYWNIINLKNPTYLLIISKDFSHNLFKNYIKYTKQIFFIISTSNLPHSNSSVILSPNLSCSKIILELIIIAHIQGKYFTIK